MAKTIQLTFYIYLTDQAQVTALQAQYPNGVSRGPLPAATEFSAPFIAEGAAVTYPCTRTGWMPPGASGKFPLDRAFFTINDGWFGHLFGRDQKYAWIGQFRLAVPDTQAPASGQTAGPMRQVAFAEGFEEHPVGSNNSPTGAVQSDSSFTRDASRMPGGKGFAIRGATVLVEHNWNTFGVTPTGHGWERIYVRLRALGTGDCGFWRIRMGGNIGLSNSGGMLGFNSSGAIFARQVTSGGSLTGSNLFVTNPLEVGRWYVLDIVYDNWGTDDGVEPNSESINFAIKLFVDHALVGSGQGTTETKVDPPTYRTNDRSSAGSGIFLGPSAFEYDLDDWIGFHLPASQHATHGGQGGADVWVEPVQSSPNNGAAVVYAGADWTHGHHIEATRPHVFDATHSANWTGDVRNLSQTSEQPEDTLTSSTASALLAANTRADLVVSQDGCLGAQAVLVGIATRRAVGGDGQLGYTLTRAGGPVTSMTTVTGNAADAWDTVLYAPSGETTPWSISALMLRYTKAADANLTTVTRLFAQVVLVGVFDQCDVWPADDPAETPTMVSPSSYGVHNAPFPRTPWNRTDVPPDSPVWVKAGTYTGNSLGQDVIAKIPAHFFWVRATNNAAGAVKWWSSMAAPHWAVAGDHRSGLPTVLEDPEFVSPGGDTDQETRSLLRLGGINAAANLNAVTYQYVAVGDPGMRFMLNMAFKHVSGLATFDNPIVDPDFLAELGFFASEFPAGGGFLFFKGPGNGTTSGQQLTASEGATFGTFLTGFYRSMATLHPAGSHTGVAATLWRQRDGADYEGLEIDEPVVVQIMSYVGDGAASRTIALPRASGKRPLWAYCQGTNTSGHVRDPSHTGITSSVASAGSATINTGFTAGGVDSVTVGSTLNGSGVSFSLFVIMAADATAGNGGWGTNGEVLYDAVPAPGGQWGDGYTQEELDELENPTTGGPDSFDDGEDLLDDLADALCVPYVKRAVNLALVRLGISDLVASATDLLTPTTRENTMIVEFYEHCLRATLRDFPWAHATRYAQLTLIDGGEDDPVNGDWIYSFRAPTGMLFARRLVPGERDGRTHNAKPLQFRMAEDSVGPLLYCNEVRWTDDAVPVPFVELEYTVRPHCGSRAAGDQLFVSTFAHKLAAEIGGPLGRDEKLVKRSADAYEFARVIAATSNVRESQQEPLDGDAPWIAERE